jgi:nitrate reductase alpha subunit
MLCGCIGRNGGGLNHYVGQEKLAPVAPWGTLAFALDWVKPPRLQNAPSFHYVHSDQWRYDENLIEAQLGFHQTQGHTMDLQVRGAWASCLFTRSSNATPWNWCGKRKQLGQRRMRKFAGGLSSNCALGSCNSPWKIRMRQKVGRDCG